MFTFLSGGQLEAAGLRFPGIRVNRGAITSLFPMVSFAGFFVTAKVHRRNIASESVELQLIHVSSLIQHDGIHNITRSLM